MGTKQAEAAGPLDAFRQFFALQRDVLVLSLAMVAFGLGFQCLIFWGARAVTRQPDSQRTVYIAVSRMLSPSGARK